MGKIISKESAMQLIRDIIGNNQGCTIVFLVCEFCKKGGTYEIDARHDDVKSLDECLKHMIGINMIQVEVDKNGDKRYFVNDFVKLNVEVAMRAIPAKCCECRFLLSEGMSAECVLLPGELLDDAICSGRSAPNCPLIKSNN